LASSIAHLFGEGIREILIEATEHIGGHDARRRFVYVAFIGGAERYVDAPQLGNRQSLILVIPSKATEILDNDISNLPILPAVRKHSLELGSPVTKEGGNSRRSKLVPIVESRLRRMFTDATSALLPAALWAGPELGPDKKTVRLRKSPALGA
jgi:hypothetical protein